MIEEITFKNILSFRDEVTFSFEATDDTTFDSAHVITMPDGTRLLKLGIVYGPNASGKSNLLYAMEFLRRFWIEDPQNMDIPTGFEPFLLDTDTPRQPSEYSIKFWINGVRYCYQLQATSKYVTYEKLSFYKTNHPIKVFERKFEEGQSVLTFNPQVQKIGQEEQRTLSLHCLPNKSFFAARGRINMKMEHVDTVREWIHTRLMPMIGPTTNMMRYSQNKIGRNAEFKEQLLNFLHLADFNITGLNDRMEDALHVVGIEHTVENERDKETYELNMKQQSAGTKRVMGIEAAIDDAVRNNAVLLIDEMETSLHPDLIEYILQEYLLKQSESQLLVTTHYADLLDTIGDLLRKDNIWFVEKNKTGSSGLYSLVEFRDLDKISHVERAYRNGQFGALPNIKN